MKRKPSNFCAVTTVAAKLLLLVALLATGGCVSSTQKGGTTRHVIFGFGVVSVDNSQTNLAVVQKVSAFGLYGGTGPGAKVGLGYMNRQVVEVVTNANLVIEVDSIGKPIKITIPCVEHYP